MGQTKKKSLLRAAAVFIAAALLICSAAFSDGLSGGRTPRAAFAAAPSGNWWDTGNYEAFIKDAGHDGTAAKPYVIANEKQLAYMTVNEVAADFAKDVHYKLGADLDMSAHYSKPIRTVNSAFEGVFDGGSKKISGLYIDSPTVNGAGLFAALGVNSRIFDLTIESGRITSMLNAGGIAGAAKGNIENCVNKADIVLAPGGQNAGGITGNYDRKSSDTGAAPIIKNCVNYGGIISGSPNCAGIAGILGAGTIESCANFGAVSGANNTGGIAGSNFGTISGSFNAGAVTLTGNNGGGIAGSLQYSETRGTGTVSGCANTGKVTALQYSGGIVGLTYQVNNFLISDCFNTGSIGAAANAALSVLGGIAGKLDASAKAVNCFSAGAIMSGEAGGGIAGEKHAAAALTNCYYENSAPAAVENGFEKPAKAVYDVTDTAGSTVLGLASAAMKGANAFTAMAFDYSGAAYAGKALSDYWQTLADGYPVLKAHLFIFQVDGGESKPVYCGAKLGAVPTAVKTGYSTAYYTDKALTVAYTHDADAVMPWGGLTIYPKFTLNRYTITFRTNGGGTVADITMDYGAAVTAPAAPERKRNKFIGWYTDEALTKPYAFGTMPAENITLYAKWEKTGMSGGAVAAIVIASVLAAAVGGFAVFWFAIKKKSFADLAGAFKKKS